MIIESTRVGPIEVTETDIIHFPHGVLGLPDWQQAVLVPVEEVPGLSWLQFLHDSDAAFLLLDVKTVFPGYETAAACREAELGEACLVRTIVTVPGGDFSKATTNLLGPLVIECSPEGEGSLRQGMQVVLHNLNYPVRQPLFGDESC